MLTENEFLKEYNFTYQYLKSYTATRNADPYQLDIIPICKYYLYDTR